MNNPLILAAILFPLLVVLLILLFVEKGSPGATKTILLEIGNALRRHWLIVLASVLGCGVVLGVIALLWGFKAGFYCSVTVFVGSLSIILFGGFGGQWVGPGAAERQRQDYASSVFLIGPALVWTIVFLLLTASFEFGGYCPWPQR